MATVRRYPSHIAAQDAAFALRAAGIVATVVSETDPIIHATSSANVGPFAVIIDGSANLPAAETVLAELDANPISADPAWEENIAAPDLSRLDPALSIPCPFCTYDVRGQVRDPDGRVMCPECGGVVDVLDAVLRRHGPEGVAHCYPEPESTVTDEVLVAAPLLCRRCHYSLAGLPPESQCPECGLPYSKRRLLRS